MESDPVWIALWYSLGFAIERRMDLQKGELTAAAPIYYEWLGSAVNDLTRTEREVLVEA
jgi:hypothetical protein